jgi:hypothetical protein
LDLRRRLTLGSEIVREYEFRAEQRERDREEEVERNFEVAVEEGIKK